MKQLGILTIGQTPRPDLTGLLDPLLDRCRLVIRGALDGVDTSAIPVPAPGAYPLETRLNDGTRITVSESFLSPLLQNKNKELEKEGVWGSVLLCAGAFEIPGSPTTMIKPFDVSCRVLRSGGCNTLGVIIPFDGQATGAIAKWVGAGFEPAIRSLSQMPVQQEMEDWISVAFETDAIDAVVFDYVGYPTEVMERVQQRCPCPVLDLGHLTVAVLDAIL